MKPHFLLLLCLCGCSIPVVGNSPNEIKHRKQIEDQSSLIPPEPKAIAKRVQAQDMALPRTTVLWRWNDTNTPPVSYRLYASPDLSSWSVVTNTDNLFAEVLIQPRPQFFAVSAVQGTNESVHYWEK